MSTIDPRHIAVLGDTVPDARAFIWNHPALTGATAYSWQFHSLVGQLVADLFTTPAFDLRRDEPGPRSALLVMRRNRAKMRRP